MQERHIRDLRDAFPVSSLIAKESDPREQQQNDEGQGQVPRKSAAQVSQQEGQHVNCPAGQMVKLVL